MNKFIYGLALTLVLGATAALGDPGGEGNNTGCNGQGNPNSPCEGTGGNGGGNGGQGGSSSQNQGQIQGQLQGQLQGQSQSSRNVNRNANSSQSSSASQSSAASNSNSNATGGSVRNTVGVRTGSATAGSNSSSQGGAGGSSDNSVTIRGDNNDYTASSAAAVFAGECQTGMSGQVDEGGFSIVNTDQFCSHVKAAKLALAAYNWEVENAGGFSSDCVEVEYGEVVEGEDVIIGFMEACGLSEKAAKYLEAYRHNVDAAINLVQKTEDVGLIDTFAGYLVRPVALIAVLILLL